MKKYIFEIIFIIAIFLAVPIHTSGAVEVFDTPGLSAKQPVPKEKLVEQFFELMDRTALAGDRPEIVLTNKNIVQCGNFSGQAFGCGGRLNGKKVIYIRTDIPDNIFIGVLAHEYGHTLGMGMEITVPLTEKAGENIYENTAENFAAYVLYGDAYRQMSDIDEGTRASYDFLRSELKAEFTSKNGNDLSHEAVYLSKGNSLDGITVL